MRYKYSQGDTEATDLFFDVTTHGDYIGIEQDGAM